MDIKNLAQFVLKVAPILGGIIGGPVGSAAISLIANAFNGKASDIPGLIEKISADPEAQIKLKQIEAQLIQIDSQNYSKEVDDRISARDREKDFIDKLGKPDYLMPFLSISITLGFFAVLICLMFTTVCDADHDVLYTMMGFLGSTFIHTYQYYFGGSHTKDQ